MSIHERSKHIDNRRSLGHLVSNLVSASKTTNITTLVLLKSRFTIILKLKGKDAGSINDALLAVFRKMPLKYRKYLTWDRGMELAKHSVLTKEFDMPVYFCAPIALGSGAQMRTLIALFDNTSPKGRFRTTFTRTTK